MRDLVPHEAEKNEETQLDFVALEDVGLKEENALIVINYFNKHLGDLTTVSELNSYCQGYLKKFKQAYFVMLHFQDGVNKERMSFEELHGYYSTLGDQEEKKFKERIEKLKEEEPNVKVRPPKVFGSLP